MTNTTPAGYSTAKKRTLTIAVVLIVFAMLIVFLTTDSSELSQKISPTTDTFSTEESYGIESADFELMDAAVSSKSLAQVAGSSARIAIAPEPIISGAPVENIEAKVIKNGSLAIRVSDVDSSVAEIRSIAQRNGGDVMQANIYNTENSRNTQKYGSLTVRIASDRFDSTLDAIKDIASVTESESVNTRDVTEEFVDTQAQLTNKKEQEEVLRGFFDKAKDVDDLIRIEQELTRVRGEIERIEGRLNYLNSQTEYSTITVSLTEDAEIVVKNDDWRPTQVAKDSVNALVEKGQTLINNIIAISISKLPFFVLTFFALLIGYVLSKKVIIFASKFLNKHK